MLELARRKYVDMPKREKPRLPTDTHGHTSEANGNPQFNKYDHQYPGMAPIIEENPLNALIDQHEYDEQTAEKYEVPFQTPCPGGIFFNNFAPILTPLLRT